MLVLFDVLKCFEGRQKTCDHETPATSSVEVPEVPPFVGRSSFAGTRPQQSECQRSKMLLMRQHGMLPGSGPQKSQCRQRATLASARRTPMPMYQPVLESFHPNNSISVWSTNNTASAQLLHPTTIHCILNEGVCSNGPSPPRRELAWSKSPHSQKAQP